MPVYQLLGGKCREAANAYIHARSDTVEAVVENIQQLQDRAIAIFAANWAAPAARPH